MSSRAGPLSSDAIDLLLELLELPTPMLAAGAARLARGSDVLISSNLLVRGGDEDAVSADDEMDDALVSLVAVGDREVGYYSPRAGLVRVEDDALRRHQVDVPKVMMRLVDQLSLPRTARPTELVAGIAWELGTARLPGRKLRVPVWFARRLWDAGSRAAIRAAADARPQGPAFILLTSSDGRRVGDVDIRDAFIVSVRDVLVGNGELAVDAAILSRRLGGQVFPSAGRGPLVLSPDNRLLTINGTVELRFNSGATQVGIRKLVDAYHDGRRLVPVREIAPHGTMGRLFGPSWKKLQPYLRSVDGRWGFNV